MVIVFDIYEILILLLALLIILLYFIRQLRLKHEITPPKLNNNPSWDVIVTQTTPLLSFFPAQGGTTNKTYQIELDTDKNFQSADKLVFRDIAQKNSRLCEFQIKKTYALKDNYQYWWRVRAVLENNLKSSWAVSRFFVDTSSDKNFSNLSRAQIKNIEVSAGYNAKNIIDYDDPGLLTFWQSPPPGDKKQWIKIDLGNPTKISRIWILSNPTDSDGWLRDFYLETSSDQKKWQAISKTKIKSNDTFRNIIDFKPVKARYFQLVINDFFGYAAQINEIILFSPKKPNPPSVPKTDYILIIGNEHNGFTFTSLAKYIEGLHFNLKTVTVPYYEASLEMLEKLPKKPIAIILSGNNADYPNLPMFEHNGEFEIIRNSHIPMLGICAGHQFMAMAYGYTRARNMGWSDISAMEPKNKMTRIKITKNDPIFENIPENFTAPEVHSWAVTKPAPEFEVIAESNYIQAQKSTKRLIYSIQFHAEINVDYNMTKPLISNFIKIVLKK